MSELWIIEAPGKAKTLVGILTGLGREAKVQATKGHILTMPDRLSPVGMDAKLHEFLREPRDIELVKRIRDAAREASAIFIATDADQEGDVIAWDVAELISDISTTALRVRLCGMDDESIVDAVAIATNVRKQDAIPGRTRAIVDRLIGAAYSGSGVAVGRVGTALLGLVASVKPSILRLNLSAAAKDGGRPWIAQADVKPPLTAEIARRLAEVGFPAMDMASSSEFTASPAHMGDIMVNAADKLDISPAETARAMQRTYEAGWLSYPRAGSRGMSKSVARKMQKVFEKAGYRFDPTKTPEKSGGEPHDAPYPIGTVDISRDPKKLGHDEGVRTMIARDLVRVGQVHVKQVPATARIAAFLLSKGFSEDVANLVANLDWRREQGPRFPGQESWGKSEVISRRPDAVLLEAVIAAGLGKPSTWANHVEGFLSRGLVDANLQLTTKGKTWVAESPPELLDPRLSVAIERACERLSAAGPPSTDREPWEALAERIVGALPPEVGDRVRALVASEPLRARRDFKALAEPGIDFTALRPPPQEIHGYAPPDV